MEEKFGLEETIRRVWRAYRTKGYSEGWIRRRLQGIAVREELTDIWYRYGVERGEDFKHLTENLSRATFGFTPSEHKQLKHLPDRESLRDHMTDLELVFSMLGEVSAAEIVNSWHTAGIKDVRRATRAGGVIAGRARRSLEVKTGRPVLSPKNFLKDEGDVG